MTELESLRREYTHGGLHREDLPDDPLVLFNQWLEQAIAAKLTDPTAMVVGTVDEQGQPFQRTVLLKHVDQRGMVFYTNLGSRKAAQLAGNNRISLLFPWLTLDRQVHVTGTASKLPTREVLQYFLSRPKESQIAAWASRQSSRITARQALESKFFELKQKFAKGDVPLPTFWGGFRVTIDSIEFWQGGEHRLHDRFIYQMQNGAQWNIERLSP